MSPSIVSPWPGSARRRTPGAGTDSTCLGAAASFETAYNALPDNGIMLLRWVRANSAPEPRCKIGWIRVPGGGVLEIFEFTPQLPARIVPWHGVGLTHISFNVRNLQRWYDYLVSKGVECVSRPERSPRGHSFFFAKDFDGNLIELMDLGHMYYVLGWLGPLGGWLFRRGMYKQYYT